MATRTEWSAEYMFCDGFMQRTMWLDDEAEELIIVVETEEGTIAIEVKDAKGNVIFHQENMETGTYEVEVSKQYEVRLEMENHKGGFYIGN